MLLKGLYRFTTLLNFVHMFAPKYSKQSYNNVPISLDTRGIVDNSGHLNVLDARMILQAVGVKLIIFKCHSA